MRTTLRLPGDLLEMAKQKAADQGRTLTAFVEDAVRTALAAKAPAGKTKLPLVHGGGLQAGIDINNSAALLDMMDGLEPR